MFKTFAAIVAGAVVALAGAGGAQAQGTAAYWGGGGIPDRVPKEKLATYLGSWGVGLRRSEDGRSVAVRVAFAVKACGKHQPNSTDAVVTADLAADGTFHLKGAPARTDELGTVAVTIDGTLAAGRADGTVSARTKWGCGLSARAFTARQIDPAAPASGAAAAPADGLLYGITFQDLKEAPHPFVFQVSAGGTSGHGFVTWTQRCKGYDKHPRKPYTSTWGYQSVLYEGPLSAGTWSYTATDRETAKERRKGWRLRSSFVVKGTFDGAALRGTLTDAYSFSDRKASVTCSAGGTQGFAAVPA